MRYWIMTQMLLQPAELPNFVLCKLDPSRSAVVKLNVVCEILDYDSNAFPAPRAAEFFGLQA